MATDSTVRKKTFSSKCFVSFISIDINHNAYDLLYTKSVTVLCITHLSKKIKTNYLPPYLIIEINPHGV